MATPMTAKQFTKQMDTWGIAYKAIHSDWATHNREGHGDWGPVYGVGLHHTGSDDQKGMPSILWSGYSDLPGPLCHGGIAEDGTLLLSGWGRCNHFGLGDSKVLNHVVMEDYTGNLKPAKADTDGNAHFYGFEIMYSGEHLMSVAQQKTALRVSAAICAWHNWTEKSVIGHGEWQPGKWDPGYAKGKIIDMASLRTQVKKEIDKGANPAPHVHTVRAGETPWSIAKEELGDGNRWIDIVKLNPSMVVLSPGDALKLPAR